MKPTYILILVLFSFACSKQLRETATDSKNTVHRRTSIEIFMQSSAPFNYPDFLPYNISALVNTNCSKYIDCGYRPDIIHVGNIQLERDSSYSKNVNRLTPAMIDQYVEIGLDSSISDDKIFIPSQLIVHVDTSNILLQVGTTFSWERDSVNNTDLELQIFSAFAYSGEKKMILNKKISDNGRYTLTESDLADLSDSTYYNISIIREHLIPLSINDQSEVSFVFRNSSTSMFYHL